MEGIELARDISQSNLNANYQIMGAVLCGGRSERFGRDKATVPIPERGPLGGVVIDAMRNAGIDPIVAIGGSFSSDLGIPTVADRWPGEGPLGGVGTALLYASQNHVLVSPCDMIDLNAPRIRLFGQPKNSSTALVAEIDGRPEPSLGLWPKAWARTLVADFRAGARRLDHMLTIGPFDLVSLPAGALRDIDSEADLAQWKLGRS